MSVVLVFLRMSLSSSLGLGLRHRCIMVGGGRGYGTGCENGMMMSSCGVGAVGVCRCEVKNEVQVEEKRCRLSGKRCVMLDTPSSKECGGPAEAARCAFNDAMLMCAAAQNLDERARNDIVLLSQ